MPSSVIIMAVAYAASEVAAVYALGTLATMAVVGAAAATASTAMNGGSWGEAFGKGFLAAGVGEAVGALGSGAGDAAAGASGSGAESLSSGLEAGSAGAGVTSSGLDGAGASATSAGGSGGLEGFGGASDSLGGGFGPGASSGATDLSMAGSTGTATGSGGLASGFDTGAMDSGIGFGSSTNSLAAPDAAYSGGGASQGGMEGFQNAGATGGADYGQYSSGMQPQAGSLGSGTYNSAPSETLGVGPYGNMTGGFGDISQGFASTGAPVSNMTGAIQGGKNVLSDFWNNHSAGQLAGYGLKGASVLADMYGRKQISNAQQGGAQAAQTNLNNMNNMYAPGSPEYNLLQQKLDRQNAAAGRRSQSLTNAGNFASQVVAQRNQVLNSPGYLANINAANSPAAATTNYNNLGTMFRYAGSMF